MVAPDPSVVGFAPSTSGRYIVPAKRPMDEVYDDHGFCIPERLADALPAEELLDMGPSLVVAEAMTGKSFVAGSLRSFWQTTRNSYVEFLSLEDRTPRRWTPAWWDEWRDTKEEACWIVDALDEGRFRDVDLAEMGRELRKLDDEQRSRLRVVLFVRDDDHLKGTVEAVQSTWPDDGALQQWRLATIHREVLADVVPDPVHQSAVIARIASCGLQPLTQYVDALKYLATPGAVAGTEREVRRGILEHLCAEPVEVRQRRLRASLGDRFSAATRLAAATMLSGSSVVDLTSEATVGAVLPRADDPRRKAAIELKGTVLLRQTAQGHRFAQRYVQEMLTAFELEGAPIEALRLLLTERDGRVREETATVLALLLRIADEPRRAQLEQLLDAREALTLRGATKYVDRLLAAADQATHYFDDAVSIAGVERLRVAGLEKALSRRLAKPTLSSASRRLVFRIAAITGCGASLEPVALELVADQSNDLELRRSAARLLGSEGSAEAAKTYEQVARSRKEDPELRATLIEGLVRHRVWTPYRALGLAPAADPGLVDQRTVLRHSITKAWGSNDARHFLRRYLKAVPTHRGRADQRETKRLVRASIQQLCVSQRASDRDLALLFYEVTAKTRYSDPYEIVPVVEEVLRANTDVRREAYQRQLNAGAGFESGFLLQPEDWPWVVEGVERGEIPGDHAWQDLARLQAAPGLDDDVRTKVRKVLESRAPSILADRDEVERVHARPATREQQDRLAISDVVKGILGERLSPDQVLWQIGWVCFSPDSHRPSNVSGRWNELERDERRAALSALGDSLRNVEPTELPVESASFSSVIIYEGYAFYAALRYCPNEDWLDGGLIAKWLPSALFALTEERADLISRCLDLERDGAENGIRTAIQRDLRQQQGYAATAQHVQPRDWSPRLTRMVTNLLTSSQADSFDVEARAAYIRLLGRVRPDDALRVADQYWDHENPALRIAAIDVSLGIDFARGLAGLQAEMEARGAQVLLESDFLRWRRNNDRQRIQDWPTDALGELAGILVAQFPPDEDPVRTTGQAIAVTPEMEIRDFRDDVLLTLRRRGDAAVPVLRTLSQRSKLIEHWIVRLEEGRKIDEILTELHRPSEAQSLRDVVAVLEDHSWRPIRDAGDLSRALLEVLKGPIAHTIDEDLEMFFVLKDKKKGREPGREDAVQAYIRRRLADLLPRVLPEVKTEQLREVQEGKRKRVDLLVLGITRTGDWAKVVVEIKWSHDQRCKSAVETQLGADYLVKRRRTHGIYLVAWTGRPKDMSKLDEDLRTRADAFCAHRPGLAIAVVTLETAWK